MNFGAAVIALAGLVLLCVGVWLVWGLGVALIVAGGVLLAAGLTYRSDRPAGLAVRDRDTTPLRRAG